MRRIITIFLMFVISSCSYYGVVNEEGERVNDINNLAQDERITQSEIKIKETQDEMQISNINELETREETTKQETQKKEEKQQEANKKTDTSNSNQKSSSTNAHEEKKNVVKTDTEVKQTSTNQIKIEDNKQTTTQMKETKYLRNDQMIEKIKQTIKNNETENMRTYGYNIVVDSSIKNQTNQFTFTETRVRSNIKYSLGTIKIYAEDYYSNGSLIMTECYIL